MAECKEKAGLLSGLSDQLLRDFFVNRDLLAVLAHALKLHGAVHEGEQRVVLPLAHVGAGVDLRSALSDKDVAGENELSVSSLGAKTLGLTVAAVLGRTQTFFMCQSVSPPSVKISCGTNQALIASI